MPRGRPKGSKNKKLRFNPPRTIKMYGRTYYRKTGKRGRPRKK